MIMKIWIKYLIWSFLVIQPKLFTKYTSTVLIYSIGNVMLFIYLAFIKRRNNFQFNLAILIWVIYRIYLLMIMIMNYHIRDIDQWGYMTIMVINIFLIIENSIKYNKQKEFLSAISSVFVIFLFINAISLLVFKRGIIPSNNIYDNGDGNFYFLGIKVSYTTYVIPALAVTGLYYKLFRKRLIFIICIFLSIFNIFYANISTGKVCLLIIIISIIIQKITYFRFSIFKCLVISILANICVVFLNLQVLFSGFITNFLHKSVTLTGRTAIWNVAKEVLKNNGIIKLFFGNGIFNNGAFVPIGGYWPPHNQWLQNLYEVGIFGTVFFIFFLIYLDKENKLRCFERAYLVSLCFAILFGTITMQYFDYAHMFIPFILLYYLKYFLVQNT